VTRKASLGLWTSLLALPISLCGAAEVLDYQIRRLVLDQTDCGAGQMTRVLDDNGGLRFEVSCNNQTFYPDGIRVQCADADDELTCRITTARRVFDSLDLMRR
jgi:hypothetical protein